MSLDNALGINRGRANEFTMVKKDRIFHNLNTTQEVKIPVYSEEPPVNGVGQLYYNSNTQCLNYSDANGWFCVHDGSKLYGNINVNNITANNVVIYSNLTVGDKATLDEVCANEVMISGNLTVNGKTTLDEVCANEVMISGNLTVNGKTTLNEVCANEVIISGDLTVNGNTTLDNFSANQVIISGDLTVEGKTTLEDLCSNNIISNTLIVNDIPIGVLSEGSMIYGSPTNTYTELPPPTSNSILTSIAPSFIPFWQSFFLPKQITKIIRFRPDIRFILSDQFFLLCYATWYKFGNMNVLHFSNSSNMQKNQQATLGSICDSPTLRAHNGFSTLISEEDMRLIFPGLIPPKRIDFTSNDDFPKYPDYPYPSNDLAPGGHMSQLNYPPTTISNFHTIIGDPSSFPAVEWSTDVPFNERDKYYPNLAPDPRFGITGDVRVSTSSLCATVTTSQFELTLFRRAFGVAKYVDDELPKIDIPTSNDPNHHIRIFRYTSPISYLDEIVNVWVPGADPRFDNFSFTWIDYDKNQATDSISGTPPGVGIVNPCS